MILFIGHIKQRKYGSIVFLGTRQQSSFTDIPSQEILSILISFIYRELVIKELKDCKRFLSLRYVTINLSAHSVLLQRSEQK